MNLNDLFTYLGSVAVLVGIGAFIARSLVLYIMGRRTEVHKADLARDLESHKATLRPVAHATEVRSTELLKRRADVIAEVYRRLVIAQRALHNLTKPLELVGEPSRADKAKAAAIAGQDFTEHYDQHKVFLPADVCGLLDDLFAKLIGAFYDFTMYGADWPKGIGPEWDAKVKGQLQAWRSIESEVPEARKELERALRTLLGETSEEVAA
jgi:hypothetical protein